MRHPPPPLYGLAAATLLLHAAPAAAQRADDLPVGAQVRIHRVTAPPARVSGVLARVDSATLTVTNRDSTNPVVVPRVDVASLEQLTGRRSAGSAFWRGAGRGALVGVGVSAVLLGAAFVSQRRNPCNDCFITAPMAAGAVSVPLTALTTLAGGVVGLRFRERWAPLPRPW